MVNIHWQQLQDNALVDHGGLGQKERRQECKGKFINMGELSPGSKLSILARMSVVIICIWNSSLKHGNKDGL